MQWYGVVGGGDDVGRGSSRCEVKKSGDAEIARGRNSRKTIDCFVPTLKGTW